jgi:hypothetical protein
MNDSEANDTLVPRINSWETDNTGTRKGNDRDGQCGDNVVNLHVFGSRNRVQGSMTGTELSDAATLSSIDMVQFRAQSQKQRDNDGSRNKRMGVDIPVASL